jgi:hypothetical protein
MLLLPRAFLSCIFFLGICAVIDGAIFMAGYFKKIGIIGLNGWPLWLFVGGAWYLSFYCALRVYAAYLRSQFPTKLQ